MTRNEIDATISNLAHSQGYYGRLQYALENATEDERDRFYGAFAGCKDAVDFVMALEG